MAKEKQNEMSDIEKQIQAKQDKIKQERVRQSCMKKAEESDATIKNQLAEWSEKIERYEKEKKFKDAEFAVKMFNIFATLNEVTQKYLDLLRSVQAMNIALDTLEKTSELFASAMSFSIEKFNFRALKKNLKKFKKFITKLQANTDKLLKALDGAFAEKRSRKDRKKSPEEMYYATKQKYQERINEYRSNQGSTGDSSSTQTKTGGNSTSGNDSGSDGSFSDGLGNLI